MAAPPLGKEGWVSLANDGTREATPPGGKQLGATLARASPRRAAQA